MLSPLRQPCFPEIAPAGMAGSSFIAHARSLNQRERTSTKMASLKVRTNVVSNTPKPHTKAHTVRGRPTSKDVKRFRNGSARENERSLSERTFMSGRVFLKVNCKHSV